MLFVLNLYLAAQLVNLKALTFSFLKFQSDFYNNSFNLEYEAPKLLKLCYSPDLYLSSEAI